MANLPAIAFFVRPQIGGPKGGRIDVVHPPRHRHGRLIGCRFYGCFDELARELGLNKATVYRVLSVMQRFELIEKNSSNERYRLGLKLHELGCRALESRSLRNEAHGFLVELSRRSNERVSLAVPGAGSIICLDRVDCLDSVITARTPVGGRFHLHCTAAGKAILAYLPMKKSAPSSSVTACPALPPQQ